MLFNPLSTSGVSIVASSDDSFTQEIVSSLLLLKHSEFVSNIGFNTQDLQWNLCEFEKYDRIKNGEKGFLKKKQFSLCRYNIPVGPAKDTTLITLYNEDGSTNKVRQVAKEIGSVYLNSDVREHFPISKSNGDMKFLRIWDVI